MLTNFHGDEAKKKIFFEKKKSKWPTFFKIANSQYFFLKIFWIGRWVSRIFYQWYYETGSNSITIFPLALSLTSGSRRTWPFGNGKVVKPVLPPNQPQGNKWGFKVISSVQTNVCNCTMCTSNDFLIYLLHFFEV